jgi:putative transposase
MPRGFDRERTTIHTLQYHFIWCPKYRKSVLEGEVRDPLEELIDDKAHDAGIDVQLVEEYDTSRTCNRCACEGVRETQGRFECPECGLDDNADKNGALNIGKRALGKFSKQLSEARAVLAQPKTQAPIQRGDEPANLSVSVGSTPSGGTPRL